MRIEGLFCRGGSWSFLLLQEGWLENSAKNFDLYLLESVTPSDVHISLSYCCWFDVALYHYLLTDQCTNNQISKQLIFYDLIILKLALVYIQIHNNPNKIHLISTLNSKLHQIHFQNQHHKKCVQINQFVKTLWDVFISLLYSIVCVCHLAS